jgi:hypothetical protein
MADIEHVELPAAFDSELSSAANPTILYIYSESHRKSVLILTYSLGV